MANQYKVQSGDTVSAIAQKFGVDQSKVSGYSSGNASLIRAGETLNIDGGPAAPSSSPAPSSPAPSNSAPTSSGGFDFNSYYKQALDQLSPSYASQADSINEAGKIRESSFESLAQNVEKQEPLVRQQYAALADQLKVQNDQQVAIANRTGTADIGNARAAQASLGLATGTGSFYQPVAEAESKLNDRIQSIATSYGADSAKLGADMAKETSQLSNEAAQYRAKGMDALATVVEQQGQLKANLDTSIRSLASDYLKAANDNERYAIEQKRLDLTEKHQEAMQQIAEQRLQLTSQRNQIEQNKANGPTVKQSSSGGLSFFDPQGNAISAADYAKKTGKSIVEVMQSSKDPSDQGFVGDFQDAQLAISKGVFTKEQATALLKSHYINLGDITL